MKALNFLAPWPPCFAYSAAYGSNGGVRKRVPEARNASFARVWV